MSGSKGVTKAIFSLILSSVQLLYWYVEALYRQIVPPPMKSIDGDTILVTGAVGGIGREICKHIIQSGRDIKLVLWDLNETSLEKFAGELRGIGRGTGLKVFHFAVDISSRENIEKCCEKVRETVGPVSIIFNNAGVAAHGNFLRLSNHQIESTIQVNLMSHFWINRQFLPDMVSRNHGRIVNISSIAGFIGGPHSSSYFASKFASNGLSESLRTELDMFQNDGVHVTTVYPWFVKTPLIKSITINKNAPLGIASLLPGFMEPEFVGRRIVDGMRREYERIYLPRILPILIAMEYFVPTKFRKSYKATLTDYYIYGDAKERNELFTPLSSVIQNRTEMEDRSLE